VAEGIEHINYAIPPKAHTPIYLMHKYWARKPHNVVGAYINHYSKEGEIVLDPFCGSGVTAIESLRSGRKVIAIDLDPIATFITRMALQPIDVEDVKAAFLRIEQRVKNEIEKYYLTKCPKCGNNVLEAYAIWSDVYYCNECKKDVLFTELEKKGNKYFCSCGKTIDTKKFKSEELIEIGYSCEDCLKESGKKVRFLIKKDELDDDKSRIEQYNKVNIPYWFPSDTRLEYSSGTPFKEGTHQESRSTIESIFTRRNLIGLSSLFNEINKIKSRNIKDIMKLIFTSNLHNVSKLNPVHQPRWRKGQHPSTSWIVHRYWVPSLRVELPVWFYFNERFKNIIKGIEEAKRIIPYFKEAKTIEDFNKESNIVISTQTALNLGNGSFTIPENSIDYVFTDPPYGGSIQYLELSTIWLSWLSGEKKDTRFDTNFKDEITINKNQGKDFEFYHLMLRNAFEEIYRVLKPGRWLTVTFHNADIKIYNSIIKAVVLSGFDLEKIIYQPPARPSAKGLLDPFGSAVGDYYIRFKKPDRKRVTTDSTQIDEIRYERIVVDTMKRLIGNRGEPTSYSILINSYPTIYEALEKNGYLFSAPEGIVDILKKHLNKEFTLIDVKNDKGEKIGQKWWLNGVSYLDRVPLAERVERAIINVLNKNYTISFDEVLKTIFTAFPNSLTPDTHNVKSILNEFAEKTKDGKWRLKPTVKRREGEHDKLVEILAKIGKMTDFTIYADLPKWRKKIEIVNIPQRNLERLQEIDVLWYNGEAVFYEFEIENTTGITEAIVRGSNIPNGKTKRIIVIPEEREAFFKRKILDPMLKEHVDRDKWRLMYYDDVIQFYEENRRKKRINLVDFDKLSQPPEIQEQSNITEFIKE